MKSLFLVRALVGMVAAGIVCLGSRGYCEDWPTFRGTDRTAISEETNLLDQWPAEGPRLVWDAPGAGRGYASPVVAAGRIFTLGDGPSTVDNPDEYLLCFDEKTGKQSWATRLGPAWNAGQTSWQGSRATPTVDGNRVYVLTAFGKLFCAKVDTGEIVWQKDLKEDFGGEKYKKDSWGYSESVTIDGDKVLCTPGGQKSTMVALDKNSGDTIWICQREDDPGAGHSSIVISNVGGKKVYVQNTGMGPIGVDAETGKLLWSYNVPRGPYAFIPTPIIQNDLVYSVGGYGTGGMLLRQVASGDTVQVEEIYKPQEALANRHGGAILVDGYIYCGSEDRNIILCIKMSDGSVVWRERGSGQGSASLIYADGKFVIRYEGGSVTLVEATPEGFKEISVFSPPGSGDSRKPSWAHPVVANGKLLLREGDHLLCYEISK